MDLNGSEQRSHHHTTSQLNHWRRGQKKCEQYQNVTEIKHIITNNGCDILVD